MFRSSFPSNPPSNSAVVHTNPICSGFAAFALLLTPQFLTTTAHAAPPSANLRSGYQQQINFYPISEHHIRLDAFGDADIELEIVDVDHPASGLTVIRGRTADPRYDHLPHASNALVVFDSRDGSLHAAIEAHDARLEIRGRYGEGYRISESDRLNGPIAGSSCSGAVDMSAMRVPFRGALGERDSAGTLIIDVYVGFSNDAASQVGNIDAEATMLVESVNSGLRNSQVEGVKLRLVGTGLTPHNPGVVTSVLTDARTWFAADIAALAPDIVSTVQVPTGATGEAGGWGNVFGPNNVVGAPWPTAFRHEVGHNAGGLHCADGGGAPRPYGYGHDNGHWRTHMCGNDVNYFSTPSVFDDRGQAIGTVHNADMARVWRENAPAMSSWATHTVPFPDPDDGGEQTPQAGKHGWNVIAWSSEEPVANNRAGRAIDGDPNTIWHSQYIGAQPRHPHEVTIEFPAVQRIDGLSYLPRQDASFNGGIADYEVWGRVGGLWQQLVNGRFAAEKSKQWAEFAAVDVDAIRLRALSEVNGQPWVSAAEFDVREAADDSSDKDPQPGKLGWQVVDWTSEESAVDNFAAAAIDGDPNTMWHSQYIGGVAEAPHALEIRFPQAVEARAVEYLPRQDTSQNGSIADYELDGFDGSTWHRITGGRFTADKSAQRAEFSARSLAGIRLRALSEVNGGPWASIAELSLIAVDGSDDGDGEHPLPATVYDFSSEEPLAQNHAARALDGDVNTMWHTQYVGGSPAHPHWISLDLGAMVTVSGLRYVPRQDGNLNGTIVDYELMAWIDGAWRSLAAGSWTADHSQKQISFAAQAMRHLSLRALSSHGNGPWASAAEIEVLGPGRGANPGDASPGVELSQAGDEGEAIVPPKGDPANVDDPSLSGDQPPSTGTSAGAEDETEADGCRSSGVSSVGFLGLLFGVFGRVVTRSRRTPAG